MKRLLFFLLLFAEFGYGQPTTSKRQRALEFQDLSWKASLARDYEKGIRFADSSILLDSIRSEPVILKAEALTALKRYREAAEAYQRWIFLSTSVLVVGAHVHLGMLYDKAGMSENAKANYLKAIQLYESGQYFQLKGFGPVEYWEYVIAFGLLGHLKIFKEKLDAFKLQNPGYDIGMFQTMDREDLLRHHFRFFEGG
jgi:tetratricopeptide (TPR) repeat protein